ncbi:MAG: hypothetical protein ACE1ZA_11290 [Pseudomonadales bacterium]
MITALTRNTTGFVIQWGDSANVRAAGAGETRVTTIPDGDASVIEADRRYTKVVNARFVAMTAGEITAVNAEIDTADDARGDGTLLYRVKSADRLPLPPPRADMLVCVIDAPEGPALAVSTATTWLLFKSTGVVGPA